jgi:hypothetical protein
MQDRFWSKVNTSNDGCWEWKNALSRKGYGWFNAGSKSTYAHRVAAFLSGLIDSLSTPLHVLHSCDNPKCCNPSHLFVGTNLDNIKDRVQKGRSKAPKLHGQTNGMAKLCNSQVKEIRGLYFASMFSQSQLAKRYGVRQSHVSRIVNNVRCGGVN